MCMNCGKPTPINKQSVVSSVNANRKMMSGGKHYLYASTNQYGTPKVKVSFAKRSS